MREILFILFCLLNIQSFGVTYYVATNGSDSNPGTLSQPWRNILYGCRQLSAGDILYVRSGTYMLTARIDIRSFTNGTAINPIRVMGYPSDINRPVIDATNLYRLSVMCVIRQQYWYFDRLIFQHAEQDGQENEVDGVEVEYSGNIIFNYCDFRSNDGCGVDVINCSTVYFTDCDAYYNYDKDSGDAGNAADGFSGYTTADVGWDQFVYLKRCRSWNNSDDGIAFGMRTRAVYDSCWSMCNGYLRDGTPSYSGRGFNVGQNWAAPPAPSDQYIIKNCVSVYNRSVGFRNNSNATTCNVDARWYNNTSAFNGSYGFNGSHGTNEGTRIYRNNIAYANPTAFFMKAGMTYISDHNTWDSGMPSVTNTDFISTDTTGMKAPRNSDGSLPDNNFYRNFLKPKTIASFIDVGVNVGFPFSGRAPDLGYWEYGFIPEPPEPPPPPPPPPPLTDTIFIFNNNRRVILNNKIIIR